MRGPPALIGGHRTIAVVTARAGSKGVPGKNLRPLSGRPLIAWTIGVAQAAPSIDRVVVSTDGDEIAGVARGLGAEVIVRPSALADDVARSADVLRHVREELRRHGDNSRYMVLLQPTSPFRTVDDIERCLSLLHETDLDSVATFVDATLHPHQAWEIERGRPVTFISTAMPWVPRQLLPPVYQLNGAVYAFVTDRLGADDPALVFGRAGAVVMDVERSLDIDTEIDFLLAEALVRQRRHLHARS